MSGSQFSLVVGGLNFAFSSKYFIGFSEYLATFKKTVAMHEVFLTRLAAHPTLRKDSNFNVFLEFKGEVICEPVLHRYNNTK